jgi:hypothetical protein
VIWLSMRLIFPSTRRAWLVSIATCLAIALGTAVLLTVVAVPTAVQARADRLAWQDWNSGEYVSSDSQVAHVSYLTNSAYCECGKITEVWIDGLDPQAPVFPGLKHNPHPGEVFVSSALAKEIRGSADVAARFPRPSGSVAGQALEGPDDLVIARYLSRSQMNPIDTQNVARFASRGDAPTGAEGTATIPVLTIAAALVAVIPVFLLLINILQLSAVGRDHRLSRLSLAGATSSQIRWIALIESLAFSFIGLILGGALYRAVRPAITFVSDDQRWFTSDLTPSPLAVLGICAAVPVAICFTSQLALRRSAGEALDVARHAVGGWHLTPWRGGALALVGLASAAALAAEIYLDLGGFVLAVTGLLGFLGSLLLLGPWLVQRIGQITARSRGVASLLAGRRIESDPQGIFRSVVGMAVAIFIATVFTVATPATVVSARPENTSSGLRPNTATTELPWTSARLSSQIVREISAVPGVGNVTTVIEGSPQNGSAASSQDIWIGDCREIARLVQMSEQDCSFGPVLARAPSLANFQDKDTSLAIDQLPTARVSENPTQVTVRGISPRKLSTTSGFAAPGIIVDSRTVSGKSAALRANRLLLTFQSTASLDRARAKLESLAPGSSLGSGAELAATNFEGSVRLRRALLIGMLLTFLIAGIGLSASSVIGLIERRRQYVLLYLSGVDVGTLRTALLAENFVPLVVVALLSAVTGGLLAGFTTSFSGFDLGLVWAVVWPTLGGLAISLLLIAVSSLSLRRLVGTEQTRFD